MPIYKISFSYVSVTNILLIKTKVVLKKLKLTTTNQNKKKITIIICA